MSEIQANGTSIDKIVALFCITTLVNAQCKDSEIVNRSVVSINCYVMSIIF